MSTNTISSDSVHYDGTAYDELFGPSDFNYSSIVPATFNDLVNATWNVTAYCDSFDEQRPCNDPYM